MWGIVWAYVSIYNLYEANTSSARKEIARRRATGIYRVCEECSALIERGEEDAVWIGTTWRETCWDCGLRLIAAAKTHRLSLRYERYAQGKGKDDVVALEAKRIKFLEKGTRCMRPGCVFVSISICSACDYLLCYDHTDVCKGCRRRFCSDVCTVWNECIGCRDERLGRGRKESKILLANKDLCAGKRKQFL